MLGISVVVITGIALFLGDKYLAGGNGTAGIVAASTAGAAVSVPTAIAAVNDVFKPVAASATALIATCVLVTSILVPILTAWWAKRVRERNASYETELTKDRAV